MSQYMIQLRDALIAAMASAACLCAPASAWAKEQPSPVTPSVATTVWNRGNFDENVIYHPAYATHGMVSSEHHLATRVGVDVLKAGGNAVDAAIAVGFALAVVLPNAGNLGGGGFMLIHDAKQGRQIALDFREQAPASATRDLFLDNKGEVIPGASLDTHIAVGVPGTVAGLFKAHAEHGHLPMAALIQPAIRLAEQGFEVSFRGASKSKFLSVTFLGIIFWTRSAGRQVHQIAPPSYEPMDVAGDVIL